VGYFISSRSKPKTDTWESHIKPHGPFIELKKNLLWMVTGKHRPDRNMVVYKEKSGGLIIHSCVALDSKTQSQLEQEGNPKILIVPNSMHRMDCSVYKKRYPGIIVVCPRVCIEAVKKVVEVDGSCEEILPKYGVNVIQPEGAVGELVYEFDLGEEKALVFCDSLFNLPPNTGFDGFIQKIMGSAGGGKQPKVTRIFKWLAIKNKPQFKEWMFNLSKRPSISFLCVGHGNVVVDNCSEKLQIAARGIN